MLNLQRNANMHASDAWMNIPFTCHSFHCTSGQIQFKPNAANPALSKGCSSPHGRETPPAEGSGSMSQFHFLVI